MVESTNTKWKAELVVSVFGTLGAGKSSCLNALLSEEPTKDLIKFKSSD